MHSTETTARALGRSAAAAVVRAAGAGVAARLLTCQHSVAIRHHHEAARRQLPQASRSGRRDSWVAISNQLDGNQVLTGGLKPYSAVDKHHMDPMTMTDGWRHLWCMLSEKINQVRSLLPVQLQQAWARRDQPWRGCADHQRCPHASLRFICSVPAAARSASAGL